MTGKVDKDGTLDLEAFEKLVQETAHQVREDVLLVKGYTLAEVKGEILKVARSHKLHYVPFGEDVLAYAMLHDLIQVTEEDMVVAPENPQALTKVVEQAIEASQTTLETEVRAKVPQTKKVRGWHVVEGISGGFVEVGGKRVRLDPCSLKVTSADKASHGEIYFSENKHARNAYNDYVRVVGVKNAVHPYEFQIRGWFCADVRELVNSHPKVVSHREMKAKLYRVPAPELYGDYWQESQEGCDVEQ